MQLVDMLAGYPPDTRGLMVATGPFSGSSLRLAKKSEIQVIDGEEFTRRLAATKR